MQSWTVHWTMYTYEYMHREEEGIVSTHTGAHTHTQYLFTYIWARRNTIEIPLQEKNPNTWLTSYTISFGHELEFKYLNYHKLNSNLTKQYSFFQAKLAPRTSTVLSTATTSDLSWRRSSIIPATSPSGESLSSPPCWGCPRDR